MQLLEFTQEEAAVTIAGLNAMIVQTKRAMHNPLLPFTPESRHQLTMVLKDAESSLEKMCAATGIIVEALELDSENAQKFFTKES